MNEEKFWQLWDCADCGALGISCETKQCPVCNHVRTFEEFDARYMPGGLEDGDFTVPQIEVREEILDLPNWFCVNCHCDNTADRTTCWHCEAPQGATDEDLRREGSYATFATYHDGKGDEGATAELVENFGPYAGMRAAAGDSFNMEDADVTTQLQRAAAERNPFTGEVNSASTPAWEDSDLPSSIESQRRTHPEESEYKSAAVPKPPVIRGSRWGQPGLRAKVLGGSAGILSLAGLVWAIIWAFTTHNVQGSVSRLHWKHDVSVQKWTDVYRQDWLMDLHPRQQQLPVNGQGAVAGVEIGTCREKEHHKEKYQCGDREVPCTHSVVVGTEKYTCKKKEPYACKTKKKYQCGTKRANCKDRGNGSVSCQSVPKYCYRVVDDTCHRMVDDTCTRDKYGPAHSHDLVPKYCHRPIYEQWCDYTTQRWSHARSLSTQGATEAPSWPNPALGPLERQTRSSEYDVIVRYKDEGVQTYDLDPSTESAFTSYKIGEPISLEVSNVGTVHDTCRCTLSEFEARQ